MDFKKLKANFPKLDPVLLRQACGLEHKSLAAVTTAVQEVDLEALKAKHKARVQVEEHVPGDIIAGFKYPDEHPNLVLRKQIQRVLQQGGTIYKIYIDGALSIIQWHTPHEGGLNPIKKATASAPCAKKCTDKVRKACTKSCGFRDVAEYHTDAWCHDQAIAEAHELIVKKFR